VPAIVPRGPKTGRSRAEKIGETEGRQTRKTVIGMSRINDFKNRNKKAQGNEKRRRKLREKGKKGEKKRVLRPRDNLQRLLFILIVY
jgi:hypothetical protein